MPYRLVTIHVSCRFYSFRNSLSCILESALIFFFSLGKVLRILPKVYTNWTTIKVTFALMVWLPVVVIV